MPVRVGSSEGLGSAGGGSAAVNSDRTCSEAPAQGAQNGAHGGNEPEVVKKGRAHTSSETERELGGKDGEQQHQRHPTSGHVHQSADGRKATRSEEPGAQKHGDGVSRAGSARLNTQRPELSGLAAV